jgi:hypothetical protein
MGRQQNRSGGASVKALESRPWTAETHNLEDDYPEAAANRASILEVRSAKESLLQHALSDGWAQGKSGWKTLTGERVRMGDGDAWSKGLFDGSIRSNALSNDELELTLASYGGREHGKTIATLMSVGARRSSGIDSLLTDPDKKIRKIEERIYRTPRGSRDDLGPPLKTMRFVSNLASHNPLGHRVGGNLRRERPIKTGHSGGPRKGGDGDGASSPLSRLVKIPQSPASPVATRSGSPLGSSLPGATSSFKALHATSGDSGFAKGKSSAGSKHRQHEKDRALVGLLGSGDDSAVQGARSRGVKFGGPPARKGGSEGGGSSMQAPRHRSKTPIIFISFCFSLYLASIDSHVKIQEHLPLHC